MEQPHQTNKENNDLKRDYYLMKDGWVSVDKEESTKQVK